MRRTFYSNVNQQRPAPVRSESQLSKLPTAQSMFADAMKESKEVVVAIHAEDMRRNDMRGVAYYHRKQQEARQGHRKIPKAPPSTQKLIKKVASKPVRTR